MVTILRLTVVTGPHKNEKFCFSGPGRCLIGRADDCFIQLVGAPQDELVSRHHCQLIIEPRALMLNDLISLNGTFINGIRVESEELALALNGDPDALDTDAVLHQGDLLTTGGTTFRMDLVECPPKDKVPAGESFWEKGETAKKGCPIQCS